MKPKRRILIFRDEHAVSRDPHEICGVVFFDDGGDIEAHIPTSGTYAYAYLIGAAFSERMVARRCSDEALDPSVVVSRVCNGEDAIREGLASDERTWKRYDAELERAVMAQELARTVKP